MWAPAARLADIPKGVALHCLRHYFAMLLIHKGDSAKAVQFALGHSTPMVTLNTYVGSDPKQERRHADWSTSHSDTLRASHDPRRDSGHMAASRSATVCPECAL
ncbi:tyrosine-type recombinase/integrase [Herbidospora cretacea]|uniref:tyrosine-type recombinase/integrase n=1 Tax=Herbidospora cretacea TaxID=28444 RepID=UPI0009ED6641